MLNIELSDQAIVERVKANKEEYREIIKRYNKPLLRYAQYLTNDANVAEDVVQQAFIKGYVYLNSYNPGKKFSSWLYRIAHNEAINIMKKNKYSTSVEDKIDLGDNSDLADGLARKELASLTRGCLEKIPASYREVLTLYYLQELTYDEISDIIHIPMSTIGVRLHRAKLVMRKICQTKRI